MSTEGDGCILFNYDERTQSHCFTQHLIKFSALQAMLTLLLMTAFTHFASLVWYAVLKFLHHWDVILRQHSPHIHFSQHEDAGSHMQLVCHTNTDTSPQLLLLWVIFFVFLLFFKCHKCHNLSEAYHGLLKANQLYFSSLSRCRFKLSSSASVYANSSLRHPVVGDFLLAPPHVHSTWNFPCYSGFSQPF